MTDKGNSPIKQIIQIFFLLVVIILVGSVILVIANNSKSELAHTLEVESDIIEAFSILKDTERGQRGFLLSGDSIYLVPYDNGVSFFKERMKRIREKTVDNPSQQSNVHQLDSLSKLKLNELNTTISLYKSGDKDAALRLLNSDIGLKVMRKIETIVSKMIGEERRLMDERETKYSYYYYALLALFTICIILALIIGFTLRSRLAPFMEQIQSSNNRLKTLVIEKNQEIKLRERQEKINQRLIARLKAKNKELDHFAYIASHDLQEPFRTVENFITLFKEDYEDQLKEGDAPQYFEFIDSAVVRMKNLINGLLHYSRIGRSGEAEDVNLNNIVEEVIADFDAIINEHNAVIQCEKLPSIHGYRFEIKRLFSNIVSNAIKFVPEDRTPKVNISTKINGENTQIEIQDNGIGIPQKNINKIFNMFSRLHSDAIYPGQGIGLAFCKKIMELHHGEISVVSEEKEGTTFILKFPNQNNETKA